MSDILERLQNMFFRFGTESPDDAANRRIQTAKDAADEIEKLRAKADSIYSERNRLAVAFARMALAAGFKAGTGVDPDETKWPVVYVETPNGQVSWHIASHDADILSGLPVYEGQWDGTYRARKADWCVWDQNEPLRTEIEKLRAENERLKAGGCARDQNTTQFCAEAVALKAEIEKLRAALHLAIDAVEHWASYASPYFQEKHDLAGDLQELRAALGEKE